MAIGARIELRASDYLAGEIGPSKWIRWGRLMGLVEAGAVHGYWPAQMGQRVADAAWLRAPPRRIVKMLTSAVGGTLSTSSGCVDAQQVTFISEHPHHAVGRRECRRRSSDPCERSHLAYRRVEPFDHRVAPSVRDDPDAVTACLDVEPDGCMEVPAPGHVAVSGLMRASRDERFTTSGSGRVAAHNEVPSLTGSAKLPPSVTGTGEVPRAGTIGTTLGQHTTDPCVSRSDNHTEPPAASTVRSHVASTRAIRSRQDVSRAVHRGVAPDL
jgi:hypothetical protein